LRIVLAHMMLPSIDDSLRAERSDQRRGLTSIKTPADGSLIVYESIIDDERRQNTFGLLMSLNMLIETPSGFDYTGRDCAGFAEPTLNIWQVPTQWWLGLNRRPARVCGCSCPLYPRKRTSIK